jgi:ATP-dependent RNA helicase DDX27
MVQDDFVMTLGSDEESPSDAIVPPKHSASKEADEAQLDPAFTFDISGDPYSDLLRGGTSFTDVVKSGSRLVRLLDVSYRSLIYLQSGSNIRR